MESKPGNSNMNVSSPPSLVDIVREEEAPFGSAQQGPNPPTTIPIRSSSRLKKGPILTSQSSGSLRDVIEEARDEVPSHSKLEAFACETKYDCQSDIEELASKYCISNPPYMCYLPTKVDHPSNATKDLCVVFKEALEAGLRFPVHSFIPDIIASFKIHPAQFVPNAWLTIICFLVWCK